MLYSKEMMSKKGALWTVWVAGVRGVAALTRDQVIRTDVAACADKISEDTESAYRILGLLLFGVARIYSKKVEYLCHDCDQLLESFETAHCIEASTSTGRSVHRVVMQVKNGICAKRLVVNQQDIQKAKKPGCSARTSTISGLISSKGLSSSAETGIISQLSLEVWEPLEPANQPMFIIPKRFELDSFDLQITENRGDDDDDHHQLPRQDTLLEDEQHNTSFLNERMTCSYADLGSTSFMPARITLPSEMTDFIDEVNNLPYSSNTGDELERENQNGDSACFTPVKDVLPPEMMNMMGEVNAPSEKRKRVNNPSREVNMDSCSIPLTESQEMLRSKDVVENVFCRDLGANCPAIEESENELLLGKSNTAQSVEIPYHDFEEQGSLEPPTVQLKSRSINELSPSTPEPFPEGVTGLQENFLVPTPAKKEKQHVTRKRRGFYNKDCTYIPADKKYKQQVKRRNKWVLYDEDIVLPNDVMRHIIADANDLVCKRKKAPHTYLDSWKVARVCSLPGTFMDPFFPCSASVDINYSSTADAPECCVELIKAKKRLSYELVKSNNSGKDAQNTEREQSSDETRKRNLNDLTDCIQSPGCFYTQNEQFRDLCELNDDTCKDKNSQVEGNKFSSTEPQEKRSNESKNHILLFNEALTADIDIIDVDIRMDEEHARDEGFLLSARTRTVAKCLQQLFVEQKQQGKSSGTLDEALKGRKRKTTARFFYETLILKSLGLLEVNQENPYENIEISPTPHLEEAFQNPE